MAEITKERVIEEIRLLPDDVLESVFDFVGYIKVQRNKVKELESQYSSLDRLRVKIAKEEHTWEEEKDLFEGDAALTEIEKIKHILKVENPK